MSANPILAGVVGWPVGHSRSPALHGHWLGRHGVRGSYIAIPVEPGRLGRAVEALRALGYAGVNVTLPHKEAALALADVATERATRIGAANTLIFREGAVEADNTDGFGLLESLRAGAPGWRAGDGPAVVLGAGGAARAAAAALLDAGAPSVALVNRSLDRAAAVADALGGPVRALPWAEAERALRDAAALVNATSLGMTGQPPLELSLAAAPAGLVVCDIVYAPLETALLAEARARGLRAVDGLGMLLHQARPGFEAWFGVAPEVDEALREAVLAADP